MRRIADAGYSTLLMPDVPQWQPAPGPTLCARGLAGRDAGVIALIGGRPVGLHPEPSIEQLGELFTRRANAALERRSPADRLRG